MPLDARSKAQTAPGSAQDGPGPLVTVSVLMLASLTIMSNAAIAPSLPGLKAHFAGAPGIDTLLGLMLTLPSAFIVLTAAGFGWLADRTDRRPLLVVATLLFAAGGASGLYLSTLPGLLIGRAALGIGVAGTMTLALAFGADLWQGAARARFLGLQGAAMSAGGIVVMLLGGALALLHWRGSFAVYLLALPIGLMALHALGPYVDRTPWATRTADRAGRAPEGPFPWSVFAFTGALAFLFMAFFYIMPTRLPFLLTSIGVDNSAVIGLVMAAVTVASLPGALNYGRIRRHLSPMSVFALSFALMAAGLVLISQAETIGAVALGVLVAGLGLGPAMPNYTTYLMATVPPSARGRASGLLTTAFFAGQFASPLISAPLVAAFGLSQAFLAIAVAMAVIALGLAINSARMARQVPA